MAGNTIVVLGGPFPGVSRRLPVAPSSNALSPFPIAIKCRNSDEAAEILKLQPLAAVWTKNPSRISLARHIEQHFQEYGVTVSQHFYPCWKSSKNAIYTNFDDVSAATAGWVYARYGREEGIKAALITFIMQNPKRDDNGRHLALSDGVDVEIVELDDSEHEEDGRAEAAAEHEAAEVERLRQRSLSPTKQISAQTKGKGRGTNPLPGAKEISIQQLQQPSAGSSSRGPSLQRSQSAAAASPAATNTDLQPPTQPRVLASVFKPSHIRDSDNSTYLLQRVRDLQGTVGVVHEGSVSTLQQPLNTGLGRQVDWYLNAHGYTQEAADSIANAYAPSDISPASSTTNMPRIQQTGAPSRYSTRTQISTKTRLPWRHRTQRKVSKRTGAEKKQLAKQRRENKERYNNALEASFQVILGEARKLREEFGAHSEQYYLEEIMQRPKIVQSHRGVNRWNVFLREEVKCMNDELPEDVPRFKSSALARQLKEKWSAMTQEQQIELTEEGASKLLEHREMKKLSVRTVPTHTFQDACRTLETIEKEIMALHARTGVEIAMFAVRGKIGDYLQPFAVQSSSRASDFFHLAFNTPINELVARYEAYCVSGAEGVVQNYNQALIRLKSELVTLIAEKLSKCVGRQVRMFYKGFDEHITSKFGVVCRGWPLPKFQSPAEMATKNEVELVMHAFRTGTTSFQRLTEAEWRAWDETRFQAALEQQTDPRDQSESVESHTSGDRDVEMVRSASEPQASSSSVPPQDVLQPSRFVNTVTTTSGMVIDTSNPKKRKKRSDAGVARGPRRKISA
ncbi:hypothetical protein HWV62_24416 [Athelia sp. TMB]|nr:hypothetical protein HWV62_24416 [Athelia sp. TMB]